MYDPKGNGKDRAVEAVHFAEAEPPVHLAHIVHRFLELKTTSRLPSRYRFHALPDVCTYIVFDQRAPAVTGVTGLHVTSEEMDLGNEFSYVNVRLMPGVWTGKAADEIGYGMIDSPYTGQLPLRDAGHELARQSGFAGKQEVLSRLVDRLVGDGLLQPNPLTAAILARVHEIHSVKEMAAVACVSPRQLQRTLKQMTGFAPHDFLKVLRLQQSLAGNYLSSYADQSHFIHSFRRATGYTPASYARTFDV